MLSGCEIVVPQFYFAYGSNMNLERMRARQVQFDDCFAGSLPNLALKFNKRCQDDKTGHANVVYAPGDNVEGVVYRVADEHSLQALDIFETTPRNYSREIFWLTVGTGRVAAWVYIANAAVVCDGLQPERWYLNHLLAGKDFLSTGYYQRLQATPCIEVDPANRPVHL